VLDASIQVLELECQSSSASIRVLVFESSSIRVEKRYRIVVFKKDKFHPVYVSK
jgi:hypothetical protein